MIEIHPAKLNDSDKYQLMIGSILPRPIAFVSTVGAKGTNAAPFSFFTGVSTSPPMIGFTVMPGPYGPKDTLRNIQENREFVVNVVSQSILEQMNVAGSDSPYGVSEFSLSGLTEFPSVLIQAPRIKEAKVHYECRLHKIVELGDGPSHFIIGEVLLIHVEEEILLDQYRIDHDKLQPVGRMAGNFYTTCDRIIKVKRQKYNEIKSSKDEG
jgi:flavin reductase (DIM6/NTAB) family NADH-FMN oxidoreductase RutF